MKEGSGPNYWGGRSRGTRPNYVLVGKENKGDVKHCRILRRTGIKIQNTKAGEFVAKPIDHIPLEVRIKGQAARYEKRERG